MGHKVDELPSQSGYAEGFVFSSFLMSKVYSILSTNVVKPYSFCYSLSRLQASRIIENSWCSYRDRQMFKLLKFAICAAVSIECICGLF